MGNAPIRNFRELRVWQESHKLVLMVYRLTKKYPQDERFGLVDQSRRAAVSITSNIAEGFGRGSAKDKKNFYLTAKASLAELQNQLIIAKDLSYISEEEFLKTIEQSVVGDKLLTNFIKSAVDRAT